MSEATGTAPLKPIRDQDGHIAQDFAEAISAAVASGDAASLKALVAPLHEADLGDLLAALTPQEQPALVRLLGTSFDFSALTELEETVRSRILEAMPAEDAARGLSELASDDAVHLLEDLDEADQAEILAQIPAIERIALQRSLDYPEESAGRLMQTDYVAVPPFWTVGRTIDHLRESEDLPEAFYEVFVVDPAYRLMGTVSLSRLLRAKREVRIGEVIDEVPHRVTVTEDQEEVARLFQRYNLVSAAVVDESERLAGIVTIDDIVDVIQEEASEDIRRLGGVGDEDIADTVANTIRSRFPWLFINMFTAFLAASVIGVFGATIEQMVALAVLMPIVASMGGNAGTQAMTVAVRAIAMRQLGRREVKRVLVRELVVGLANATALAAIVGAAAGLWFGSAELGAVIGVALIVNMVIAGLSGTLIPVTLNRLKADPAVSSAVFLTAVTDVVGFFAFLGIASWWFGLA